MMRVLGWLVVVIITAALMGIETFTITPSWVLFSGAGIVWLIGCIGLGDALYARRVLDLPVASLAIDPPHAAPTETIEWDWPT